MKNVRIFMLAIIAIFMLTAVVFAQTDAAAKTSETAAAKPDAEKVVPYVLDHCIISGEKLGGMGDPVVKVYDGREVKFCCNGCVKPFEKDQAKNFKKIDDAIAASQNAAYPMETCVVTGEKLGKMGDPVEYVYHNQLVRFCCKGCIPAFKKDPAKFIAMIDAAAAKKADVKTGN